MAHVDLSLSAGLDRFYLVSIPKCGMEAAKFPIPK
jgi:hypothetical protein